MSVDERDFHESDWDSCRCGHPYLLHVHPDRGSHECAYCPAGDCERYEAAVGSWWSEMVKNFKRGWRRG